MTKTIYHYDHKNGALLGASAADESPLEPGIYLIPAFATAIAPPEDDTGHVAVFRDGNWQMVEDNRGVVYFLPDRSAHVMDQLGAFPADALSIAPPPAPEELAANARDRRDRALSASDWTMLPDAPEAGKSKPWRA